MSENLKSTGITTYLELWKALGESLFNIIAVKGHEASIIDTHSVNESSLLDLAQMIMSPNIVRNNHRHIREVYLEHYGFSKICT